MTTTTHGYPYQLANDLSDALRGEFVTHEIYCTTSYYSCTRCPDWKLDLHKASLLWNPMKLELYALATRLHLADVVAKTALPMFVEQMVLLFLEQSIERLKEEVRFRAANDGDPNDMGLQVFPGSIRMSAANEVLEVFATELKDELEHRYGSSEGAA